LIPFADINLADNANWHARRRTHIHSESDDDEHNAPRHGRGGSTSVSQSQYFAFELQNRNGIFSPLLHSGRLCQEFCVDAWVCVEANCLNFACTYQAQLVLVVIMDFKMRLEQGLMIMHRLGRQVILPSSIPGTPRCMKQLYQDAMAICRRYSRADFFVTFTCNPK
jgi:hypothetical protein